MNEVFEPLVLPTFLVIAATWFVIRSISNTQGAENPVPVFTVENIEIKIFKGNVCESISVENTLTPKDVARKVFTSNELRNKVPVVVWNGRKLFNEMSIGLQGVKNGNYFHVQLVEESASRQRNHGNHNLVTIGACATILAGFWWVYWVSPQNFSFLSRILMVSFTEVLAYMVFKIVRNYS